MRLSVITATYNLIEAGRAEMFQSMASHVRAQSHKDVEHLVVDGASSDGTRVLAEALPGVRVRSEPDRGVYDAMNKGAAEATGEYLLFLNSDDDLLGEDAVARVAHCARSRPDFLAAPVLCRAPDGTETLAGVSRFFARVLVTMPFCHQGLVMRRSLFEALGGFDLRYPVAADYDLVLRMFLARARGTRMDQPFSVFRPGGISADRVALARDHRAIWQARLPGASDLAPAEWEAAEARRSLPRPVLRNILRNRDLPSRIRWIARWHLMRGRG